MLLGLWDRIVAAWRRRPRALALTSTLLCGLIFLVDMMTPLGVVDGVPYIVPILMGLWSPWRLHIPVAVMAATTLTMLGWAFSPVHDLTPLDSAVVLNRALSLFALWAAAVTGLAWRRMDARLQAEREERQHLFDNMEALVLSVDRAGRIQVANRRVAALLQRPVESLVGQRWVDLLVLPEEQDRAEQLLGQLLRSEQLDEDDWELSCGASGRGQRTCHWRCTALRDERGEVKGVLLSGMDITERKQLMEKLRQQETLAHLGEMAAMVAHEVKNPLASISGVLQVLSQKMPVESTERRMIGNVLDRVRGLDAIVRDLLIFARQREPHFEETPLRPLLSTSAQAVLSDPHFARIRIVFSGEEPMVRADAQQLQVAIGNLLLNAAQAMGGEGTIQVSVQAEDGGQAISITDEGPGIPPEIQDRIFQPFFTTRTRGTGLGLLVVQRTAEAHGGRIRFVSPPGQGATFTLWLPG